MCHVGVNTYATTMSDGSKVAVITNFFGDWESRWYFITLKDLGLKLEKGEHAIITDLYDPTYHSYVDREYSPIWAGNLKSHSSRVFKIKVGKISTWDEAPTPTYSEPLLLN